MTKQYTKDWLDYWSTQDDKVYLNMCPCCGLQTFAILCEHCGYDTAEHDENMEIAEVQAYVDNI